tara:strand:+ start:386 stop:607 length:222 start_codon:yes stop_codon:yes gene_type:complete
MGRNKERFISQKISRVKSMSLKFEIVKTAVGFRIEFYDENNFVVGAYCDHTEEILKFIHQQIDTKCGLNRLDE